MTGDIVGVNTLFGFILIQGVPLATIKLIKYIWRIFS